MGYAIARLVPEHLAEVKARRLAEVDKVERQVCERLNAEIRFWDSRAARLREEERAGKDQRINAQNAEARAQRLVDRLHLRQGELDRERRISAEPPLLRGAALILPIGLLRRLAPAPIAPAPSAFCEDATSRAEIERLAMNEVMAAERALGNMPRDVSAEKKGWDIESREWRTGHLRFIEVKGRADGGEVVIITKNEILASLNAPEAFILAFVRINAGFAHAPVYVRRFCSRELGFAETAVVFNVADLVSLGEPPS